MKKYNHNKIERKWRKIWEEQKIYRVDLGKAQKPYYNLMMFPYPSAEGLHVGNVYAFTGSDVHGRFMKMRGYDVFEPIGFDAFGIHSENFAIKKRIHPKILIRRNVNNFRRQLKSLGCIFDWRQEIDTTKPDYYKWTQWVFLQLFKAGLAYRKKASVDWCPSCKTVLADEQVINGRCERCDSEVIQRETEQWFLKITKYTERLLKNLNCLSAGTLGSKIKITEEMAKSGIDWSERTKISQKNWIGRSEGWEIEFNVKCQMSPKESRPWRDPTGQANVKSIKVFTTRIDTLFGCSYLVIAPEHPLIEQLKDEIINYKFVKQYIENSKKKTEIERISGIKEKTGAEIKGIKAINPANNREIPIFAADYVLMNYGTGAIMAVPAHDRRDFDFAKRYNLPIIEVISPQIDPEEVPPVVGLYGAGTDKKTDLYRYEAAYEGKGVLVNSSRFNGMKSEIARERIGEWLASRGLAKKSIHYKLRDWLISRQRYWGPPIPVIYCEKCGVLPVPEKNLPVLLPYVKNFRPKGTGKSPLASFENFVRTKCPKCRGPAKRETDVSDTFLDSSWYFFRYPSVGENNKPFSKKLTKKWLPVDMYIGGQEHAVLHLLYTRFITMVLNDLGYVDFEEPFRKFRAHGLITKNGAKMSKSKGNVVNPDEYYRKYGADVLRMYLMFLGPFFRGGDWQDRGVVGVKRFLEKVWRLQYKLNPNAKIQNSNQIQNPKLESLIHKTIKKVGEDLKNLQYNTAISALMVLANKLDREKEISLKDYSTFLILLSPFAPHIAEELWSRTGLKGLCCQQKWPKYDPKMIEEKMITLVIQINGKVRDKVEIEAGVSEEKAKELALSSEKIKKWIEGKEIKKIIFVAGKLVNFVALDKK